MKALPADFFLRYFWCSGSVPPPYYSEYTLEISWDGSAVYRYLPDYPQHNPTVMVHHFRMDEQALEEFWNVIKTAGIQESSWIPADGFVVGGSQSTLEITARDRTIQIPADLRETDAERIAPVYNMIRKLISLHVPG